MSANNSCNKCKCVKFTDKQIFKMNQKIIQQYIKSKETVQIKDNKN